MDYVVPTIVILLTIAASAWWIRYALRSSLRDDPSLSLLQNQMNATAAQTSQQMDRLRKSLEDISSQVTRSLSDSQKNVGDRLDGAARVIQGVSKQLGQLGESTRHIFDLGKDISKLQETLRSPKLRGNLSELFLGDLLAQILPPGHFKTQYRFRGGEIVDAVVVFKAGMIPVDAKFPLENFSRLVEADDDASRVAARKAFIKDVKVHIDAISSKYIRTDEGTLDFALMYIPAENVYYETIIKEDEGGGDMSLFTYTLNKRVIPVSPNSFYAYLQTILLGLKGMRVEESARDIINNLSRLQKEVGKFSKTFELVGTHLDRSRNQYNEAGAQLGRINEKMGQIEGLSKGVDTKETLALTQETQVSLQ